MDVRWTVAFLAALVVPLGGCLDGPGRGTFNARPAAGWIPAAHVGDLFEYDTWVGAVGNHGWLRSSVQAYEVRDGKSPHPWYEASEPGFRIVTVGGGSLGTPREVYVDAADGRILGEFVECPVAFRSDPDDPWTCYDRLAAFSASSRGHPWALGSSIFQGRFLYEGAEFRATFLLDRRATTVEYRVEDAVRHGDDVVFRVKGTSLDDEPVPFIQGEWTLSTGTPYALSHAHSTILHFDGQTYLIRHSSNLTRFEAGGGQEVPRTAATASEPPLPILPLRPAGAGVPPGLGLTLGWHGFGFQPALRHLAEEDGNAASRMRADGFRVEYLQAPRATSSIYSGRMPVTDDWLTARETLTAWIQTGTPGLGAKMHVVPWRCEYSGSPMLRDCGFREPEDDDAWPSPYGPIRSGQLVSFTDAVDYVQPWLPHEARLYRVMLVDNLAATEEFEEAHYRYTVHFRVTGNDGEPAELLAGIALDARTGRIQAGFAEHPLGEPVVRPSERSPTVEPSASVDSTPIMGDYRDAAPAWTAPPPETGAWIVG